MLLAIIYFGHTLLKYFLWQTSCDFKRLKWEQPAMGQKLYKLYGYVNDMKGMA